MGWETEIGAGAAAQHIFTFMQILFSGQGEFFRSVGVFIEMQVSKVTAQPQQWGKPKLIGQTIEKIFAFTQRLNNGIIVSVKS